MAESADADLANIDAHAGDVVSTAGSSTSNNSARRRRRKSKNKKNGAKPETGSQSVAANGHRHDSFQKRRGSLGKAARDPRDEPPAKRSPFASRSDVATARAPSPVIASDGLSRPSTQNLAEEISRKLAIHGSLTSF